MQLPKRCILLVQVQFGFIDLKFNCRYSFRTEKKEKLLILLKFDRLNDDITMHIVWFLLQIIVKFAHLNQWQIHATSNNHCRLVGGVFCLLLLLYEGPKLRISISG